MRACLIKLIETGRIVVGADACRVLRVARVVADEVPEGRLSHWESPYMYEYYVFFQRHEHNK
jgi:hypothetical protein